MADELDPMQEAPPVEEPTAPPAEEVPAAPVAPTTENEVARWKGRLDKQNEALRRNGFVYDSELDDFRQVGGGPAPQSEPEPEPEPEAIPDPTYDPQGFQSYVQQQIDAGVRRGLQTVMPLVAPNADSVVTNQIRQIAPDAADIEADVVQQLKEVLGYDLTNPQVQANPQILSRIPRAQIEMAIAAARFRKVAAAPVPPVDPRAQEEANRQTLLAAAATLGGVGGGAELPSASDVDPEVLAMGKKMGLTEEQTIALANGPARIGGE